MPRQMDQVRERAPEAFRAETFRAVRPEDYNAAAARLAWVQRAGTVFRWTGSWNTVFVTADPKNVGAISRDQHVALSQLIGRQRLAGYEAYAPPPSYVAFDLRIAVCAQPHAFRGDVFAGIDRALRRCAIQMDVWASSTSITSPWARRSSEVVSRPRSRRSPVSAGVLSIQYRRRGQTSGYVDLPAAIAFGSGEILASTMMPIIPSVVRTPSRWRVANQRADHLPVRWAPDR